MMNKSDLRNKIFQIKYFKKLWSFLSITRSKYYLKFNPKVIANNTYKSNFHKDINWENPTDLIEKIQWLQLYSDTSLWTICSDKYLVREYVQKKGLGNLLNTLYGKWNNVDKINWDSLPNTFVLKSNHSCGEVKIVKSKSTLDIRNTKKQLNKWLNTLYGYSGAQMHYLKIKPCIIAEEKLINTKNLESSLVDYKIWCFHGKPECILVVFNRTSDNYSLSLFDLEWNNISERGFDKSNKHYSGIDIEKPSSLNQMINAAKKLSEDLIQVRVDFYDLDNKAIFGEMTFTTGFGYFSKEYYEYLGSKINLSSVEKLSKPNTI